jgi:hypothetical protein
MERRPIRITYDVMIHGARFHKVGVNVGETITPLSESSIMESAICDALGIDADEMMKLWGNTNEWTRADWEHAHVYFKNAYDEEAADVDA